MKKREKFKVSSTEENRKKREKLKVSSTGAP